MATQIMIDRHVDKKGWKAAYMDKMRNYMGTFSKILIVGVDNIGSRQMMTMRHKLRGKAEILMGKNTLMRKCLRDMSEEARDNFSLQSRFPPFFVLVHFGRSRYHHPLGGVAAVYHCPRGG